MRASLTSRPSILLLGLSQTVWAVVLASSALLTVAAIPARFAQLNRLALQLNTQTGVLGPVEAGALSDLGLSLSFYAGYVTAFEALTAAGGLLVGAIIFWRKRDDGMAMFVSVALITLGTFPTPLMTSVSETWPALSGLVRAMQFVAVGPSFLLLYVFPDGRFVPPWTRWAGLIWIGYSVAWLFVPALRPPVTIFAVQAASRHLLLFILAYIGIGVYGQILRYRRHATAVQRQQTKWIVFGFTLTITTFIGVGLAAAYVDFGRPTPGAMLFLMVEITVILLTLLITPVTVMASILQYRLWDIDLLIRRTLSYSALTAALAAIYFISVMLLQNLFRVATGQARSPLVTVLSTLALAALMSPLRRRVQDFIDRRFYRRKYDAEQALAQFAAAAREEVDMDKLTAALLGVVEATVRPESARLWLQSHTPAMQAGDGAAEEVEARARRRSLA